MKFRFVLVLVAVVLLVGCGSKKDGGGFSSPTSPSTPTAPVAPSLMKVNVRHEGGNMIRIRIYGNIRRGLAEQLSSDDSLSGGTIQVGEYSCGFKKKYANGLGSPNDVVEYSDSAVFTNMEICGGRPEFEVWVETFKKKIIHHRLQKDEVEVDVGGASRVEFISVNGIPRLLFGSMPTQRP